MAENNQVFKGILAGVAGGMVATWAVTRFYRLARDSSHADPTLPYLIGAGLGVTYAGIMQRREHSILARVPLGAALWLGEPEKTAAPPKGGRGFGEKAEHLAMRMAARGLKRVVERALSA